MSVALRSNVPLPGSTIDQHGAAFTIAGLSGITLRARPGRSGITGEFLAVMDNSNKLVRLSVTFGTDGSIVSATVLGGISLSESRDFEGIAYVPETPEAVYLSEEGVPSIRRYSLADGSPGPSVPTPDPFTLRRDNFGFESLSRRDLSGELWTANEEALVPDGAVSSPSVGTVVRIEGFTGPSLTPSRQFAYLTQPMHGGAISGGRSGVSDLVVLPRGQILVLERSLAFSLSGFFQSRIYEIDSAPATETSSIAGLAGQSFTAANKRLLWSGNLNNLEGLCLGPRVAPGVFVLVGVVDDGDPLSSNTLVSFVLTGGGICIADFNGDGVASLQDLFDFLASYFGGQAAADINGSGTLSVQDLFDFLAEYFAAPC